MERLFIFAIGGTGARVLRSFTMLLASGQDSLKDYDVYPIILDYDSENGDTAIATNCIETYNRIHNIAWKDKDMVKEAGFFKSNLCQLKDDSLNGGSSFQMVYAPKGNNVYKKYIGYDTLGYDEMNSKRLGRDIDTTGTKMLLQSLYNTDPTSDDSEMNLKMDVGFKGNPNIGSVVFHDIDSECSEFKAFLMRLTPNDKVVVVGSLFGGTGSSGIPEIIRKIREKNQGVHIGAVLVMPYFAPESKDGGTIRHDIFNSKTKAAINYYEDSGLISFDKNGQMNGGAINSAYFIGDPKPTVLPYCDGGGNQKNPANICEFISALSIIHFVQGGRGSFKYGVGKFIVGDGVSVKQLFYDDLKDENVKPIIRRLTSFTVAIKYFMFRTMQPDSNVKRTTYYSRFTLADPKDQMKTMLTNLKSFWSLYKAWLDELSNMGKLEDHGNSHGLTLYGTKDDLEILIVNHKDETPAKSGGFFGFGQGGSKKKENKSVEGPTIDGLINKAINNFKPNGFTGDYTTRDEEFLFMHGLYVASTDEKEIINKVFD